MISSANPGMHPFAYSWFQTDSLFRVYQELVGVKNFLLLIHILACNIIQAAPNITWFLNCHRFWITTQRMEADSSCKTQ